MEIALTIIYTLIFVFLIRKIKFFHLENIGSKYVIIAFILKIVCGIILFFIYTYYYPDRKTADIFRYFDDSRIIHSALFHHPLDYFRMLFGIDSNQPHLDAYYNQMNNWYRVYESSIYNDNQTIIRFNAVCRLFSFGYYNIHSVFANFLSFTGLIAVYKFFCPFFKNKSKLLFAAIFLMPSVLFWGSGVLKESLLLFALGMLLYHLGKLKNGIKDFFLSMLVVVFSIFLMLFLKSYILLALSPALISYYLSRHANPKKTILTYITVTSLYFLAGFNVHYILPQYDALQILVSKQHDFINMSKHINAGSYFQIGILEPNIASFLRNSPVAFINVLTKPAIFEAGTLFTVFAAIENTFIIIGIIITLGFASFNRNNLNIFCLSLLFVIITYTLTGLITPVMGALVRYKMPALPFLAVSMLILFDKEKFKKVLYKAKFNLNLQKK